MAKTLAQMTHADALAGVKSAYSDVAYALDLAEAWMLGCSPDQSPVALTALQLGMLERAAKSAISVHGATFTQFVRAAGEMYLRAQEEGDNADHQQRKIPGGDS